ncbi:MAG: adenylate kinase [Oscillospiraceae bacterium]|jgi:adenylate kinase|nr:adenylate kinase [Oscillospiraceae bacterium]
MNLILLGAPGAGKGTQAELIAKQLQIPTISTGNILREAIKNQTPTGLKAKDFMDKGMLVPDDVIIGIVSERLAQDDCKKGYILDGVPRTAPQAQALQDNGIELDCVVSIEIDDAVIARRMTGRRVCSACGASYHITANPPKAQGICNACSGELVTRKDDVPETVQNRLAVYHAETEVLKDFYAKRGKLVLVNGDQPIADATRDILAAIGVQP